MKLGMILIQSKDLPFFLWAAAVKIASYGLTRSLTTILQNIKHGVGGSQILSILKYFNVKHVLKYPIRLEKIFLIRKVLSAQFRKLFYYIWVYVFYCALVFLRKTWLGNQNFCGVLYSVHLWIHIFLLVIIVIIA